MLTSGSPQSNQSSGTVVLADIPPMGSRDTPPLEPVPSSPNITPPSSPPPPPPPQPAPDTFVIPSFGKPPPPPPQTSAFQVASSPPPPSNGGYQLPPIPTVNPWPKRIMVLGILALIIIGVFFGVKTFFSSMSGGGNAATPEVTGKNQQDVTVVYWGLWEDEAVIRPVIQAFQNTHPHITIQYVANTVRDYRQRVMTQLRSGTGPDVFRFHNTWVAMLQNDLSPVPSTVMTSDEFSSTFYPVASTDLVAGTTIYGIPLMFDGLGLYYNQELFTAAGVATPPTTWEEIVNAGGLVDKLTAKDGTKIRTSAIALGTTNNIENFSDIIATMMYQNGANLVSPTGSEAEQTLQFYRKFATPGDPLYTWDETMDNAIYAFATGRVAMILAPSWRAFSIKEINPNIQFGIAPFPQLSGVPVSWASYWVEGVSSQSKNKAAAWEFVKYLTSKEGATLLYSSAQQSRQLFGEPYARRDMGDSIKSDPYIGAFVTMAANAKSFPLASRTFDGDTGINTRMIKYLENAVNAMVKGSSASQELTTLSKGFTEVLTSFGLIRSAPQTSQ